LYKIIGHRVSFLVVVVCSISLWGGGGISASFPSDEKWKKKKKAKKERRSFLVVKLMLRCTKNK
jgi:hypothetical protein